MVGFVVSITLMVLLTCVLLVWYLRRPA